MSEIEEISEKVEELEVLDSDYEDDREADDQENAETINKLIEEDQKEGNVCPGRGIFKPSEVSIKLSDFKNIRYPMRRTHMGYFLIFNQEKFKSSHAYHKSPRAGSSVDAEKLQKSMEKLGFVVYRYDNRKTEEIEKYLKQYTSAQSNENVNAFGCAFFSHGEKNGELATYDGYINASEIVESVQGQNAPYLIGRPKIFFFQACRGGEYMDGTKLRPVAYKPDEQKKLSWPDAADILCHYATTEGHLSFRSPVHGSWFIRSLTSVIDEHATKLEFHHVLLRVNATIADIESQTGQVSTSGKKQAAQIQSQFTKELWFGDYKTLKK